MGQKKIKKRANIGQAIVDPELEDVGEDRSFEVEFDEDLNEIIFVYHYRRKWGDNFDSDVEHGLNIEEAGELISVMINIMDTVKRKLLAEMEKSTPIPIEGNPSQGPQNYEGK